MMILKHYLLVPVLLAAGLLSVSAQDPVFSQAYRTPLYLNPAATGAAQNDLRVSLAHRRQWLTIPSQFNYTVLSVDKFFPYIKGGVGLMVTDFSEGYLKRTGIYGSYSYTICSGQIDVSDNPDENRPTWFVTGALQAGMMQGRIDYSKLLFADQINENGVIPGSASSADPPIFNRKWRFDFAGGLYFSRQLDGGQNLILGGSARHINRPDESLTATSDTFRSPKPIFWNVNGSYTFPGRVWSWSVALLYYQQAQSRTMQFGLEARPRDYDFGLGVWGHFGNTLSNVNAVGINITYTFHGSGAHKQRFDIGLAQDFPVGGSGLSYTTGSTEVGFTWDYDTHANTGESENRCKPLPTPLECPKRAGP